MTITCYGCGGDRLPLVARPPSADYPDQVGIVDLCELCERSFTVARARLNLGPLTAAERDVLLVGHLVLAEMRGSVQRLTYRTPETGPR